MLSLELRFYIIYDIMFGTPGRILALRIDDLATDSHELPEYDDDDEGELEGRVPNDGFEIEDGRTTVSYVSNSMEVTKPEAVVTYKSTPRFTRRETIMTRIATGYTSVRGVKMPSRMAVTSPEEIPSVIVDDTDKKIPDQQEPPQSKAKPLTGILKHYKIGRRIILLVLTFLEEVVSVLEMDENTLECIGIEGLAAIVSDTISKVSAIATVLILLGIRVSWSSCLDLVDMDRVLLQSGLLVAATIFIEIPYMLWEANQVGYNLNDVIDTFRNIRLGWQCYGMFLFSTATAAAIMIAVEFGMFSKNLCFE
ncbi:hypothetical protein HDU76_001707 [Blyttiomyces sp. JEL0837]|nr:hypothetical protein HDU76_001707 [Blyttiomyces sp. JEL0837]